MRAEPCGNVEMNEWMFKTSIAPVSWTQPSSRALAIPCPSSISPLMLPVSNQGARWQMSMEDRTDQRDEVSVSIWRGELKSGTATTSRGRVREYHYVLKMTSRHFQHVLFFTIDIFSMCCFGDTFSTCCFWRHFQHVLFLMTLSARTVVTFQHGAIWLVLLTTFSARSHLIGPSDYIFSTKPFHWKQFQHGHLWLAGSFVIFSTEHFRWLALIATHHDNTDCMQQQQWYFTYSKGNTI